jgi:hypothetical protein
MLIPLKHKLYFMFLYLFKIALINPVKYIIIIIIISYAYQLNAIKNYLLLG